MAIITFSNGKTVNFNGTPTQADIEEVAASLGVNTSMPTNPDQPTPVQAPSFNPVKDVLGMGPVQQPTGFFSSLEQNTIGSQGLAGVAQMPGRVAADYLASQGAQQDFSKAQQYADQAANLKLQAKNTIDPIKKQQLLNQASSYDTLYQSNLGSGNVNQQFNYTPSQALGTTLNAGLTALTGSNIGGNGLLKSAAEKSLINSSVPLSTISTIGKAVTSTPARLAENAALGIAYNAASNLNQNQDPFNGWKTAAFFGAVVPEAIRGSSKVVSAIQTGAQEAGKGLINSLIKPLQKNFAYSKDPARGILAEGIKANSLDDFGNKVDQALTKRVQQSRQIGQQVSNRLGSSLDFSGAVNPIDKAIDKAAQMNNDKLFNSLQDVKTALTSQLGRGVDEKGNPTIVKIGEKQLTNRTYNQGLDFLHDIASHTRYTGNPSDDKALNQATQQAYRYVRSKLNEAAQKAGFGKQSVILNERISDLISAQSAIAHRELVTKGANIIDLASKFGVMTGVGGSLALGVITGNWAEAGKILIADLVATGAAKAAGSTAVKTRAAQFLNGLGPVERQSILNSTPALKNWYERLTGNKAPTNPDAEKTLPLKIATEPVQTAKDFASKMAEFLPFLKLGKKAAEKAGMGDEYKALLDELKNK